MAWFNFDEPVVFRRVWKVNRLPEPDANHAISTNSHNFFGVSHEDLRYWSGVAWTTIFPTNFELDESIVPNENVSPFAAGYDFLIWHRADSVNVANFSFPEPSDQALQFKARESRRHFPELDVAKSTSSQLFGNVWREHQIDDVIWKGLSPQLDFLAFPIPNCQHIVRVASLWCQQFAVACVVKDGELPLGSFFQHSNQFHFRKFVNEDRRFSSVLGNCEVVVFRIRVFRDSPDASTTCRTPRCHNWCRHVEKVE